MIRIIKYVTLCLFTLLVLTCKRTVKEDIIGPELVVTTSDFKMINNLSVKSATTNQDSIIFFRPLNDTSKILLPTNAYFNAGFNKEVSWQLDIDYFTVNPEKIKAIGSGTKFAPKKTFKGTGSLIDSSNTLWNGNSDNSAYFVNNDSVNVKLSFLGSDTVISKVYILSINNEANDTTQAIIINDFEGGFSQVPYIDAKDPNPTQLPGLTSSIVAAQGSSSILIGGTDFNGDYFVGGFKVDIKKGKLANFPASDIYINMYVYGFSSGISPGATKLSIGISEDDNNNSGTFDASFEDTFDQQISVDWVGWKLISVKYSNLKRSSSMLEGGSGNNKIEPDKAVSINCNLLSSPNGNTVATAVDYMIVTFGKPYEK